MARLSMKMPKEDIINYFEGLSSKVFTRSQIDEILSQNKDYWRLSSSTTVNSFIQYLLESTKLKIARFEFPKFNVNRYSWGEASVYEFVASLKPKSYFTHYTAMFFHELTDQLPKIIYLNFEQPRKYSRDKDLEQSRIDSAFKRNVRVSKNIGDFNDHKICILNGMFTGLLGVIEFEYSGGAKIPIASIERTLIDIAVRPVYSGGVFEVLGAYTAAAGKCSINRLASYLKKMDYVYPYHQVIGFYLEKSGTYTESQLNLLRKFEIKNDFYLMHGMKDMDYSKNWRLFFPKGI